LPSPGRQPSRRRSLTDGGVASRCTIGADRWRIWRGSKGAR
jgi:hypothetical protein